MLPDDTWFYPGHGNDSTLGAERGSIPGMARTRMVIGLVVIQAAVSLVVPEAQFGR